MFSKANLHHHGPTLAKYLLKEKNGERVEFAELRGFADDNILLAFMDVGIQAAATRTQKPFMHGYVRLPDGETLNRKQWQATADRMEKALGFEGQPRAVFFHYDAITGEAHLHVAWSRIDTSDPNKIRAIDPGLYKRKLKEMSRELEIEFGLRRVSNERALDDKTQSPRQPEFEESRRLGTDIRAVRNAIRDCWERADSGKSFIAALEQQGMTLARGDRRDFVVVDHEGGQHALGKRITGATAKEIRERLADIDIDRANLPRVEDVRTRRQERAYKFKAKIYPEHQVRASATAAPTLGKTGRRLRSAWSRSKSEDGLRHQGVSTRRTLPLAVSDIARSRDKAALRYRGLTQDFTRQFQAIARRRHAVLPVEVRANLRHEDAQTARNLKRYARQARALARLAEVRAQENEPKKSGRREDEMMGQGEFYEWCRRTGNLGLYRRLYPDP